MIRKTYIELWKELSEKPMIFISGPRQVGKTTISKEISKEFANSLYFNWDLILNKKKLIENPLFFTELERKDQSVPLIILDEIHKYKEWKNYLKGIYDQFFESYRFLVLGSGRLDIYQKGSDSLAGRYFSFNVWPFTISEISGNNMAFPDFIKNPLGGVKTGKKEDSIWRDLTMLSGFPEPFLSGREIRYKRWSSSYYKQIIREDIRDFNDVQMINDMELLFSLIPSRVGSPFSIDNLAGDLHVSHNTVKRWLDMFESFYLLFRISPWTNKISRAISKETKVYLFDYVLIESPAARFENMVALELAKSISIWNNLGYGDFKLHYVRNKEKEEVDFLISNKNIPFLLVETKFNDTNIAKPLKKFQNYLNIPAVQLVNHYDHFKKVPNCNCEILVAGAPNYLSLLPVN